MRSMKNITHNKEYPTFQARLEPPPQHPESCEWNMGSINEEDLLRQKLLIVDLIDVKWQYYRSTDKKVQLLTAAGFSEIKIRMDQAGIFPTVTAIKS